MKTVKSRFSKTVNSRFRKNENCEFTVFIFSVGISTYGTNIGGELEFLVSTFIAPNVTQYYNCEITLRQISITLATLKMSGG